MGITKEKKPGFDQEGRISAVLCPENLCANGHTGILEREDGISVIVAHIIQKARENPRILQSRLLRKFAE